MDSSLTLSIAIVFAFSCLLSLLAVTSYRSGIRPLGDRQVGWACQLAAF